MRKMNNRKLKAIKRKTKLDKAIVVQIFNEVKSNKTTHVKYATAKGGWLVVRGNKSASVKTFKDKTKAVGFAIDSAKKNKTELTIHSKDGKIISSSRYGNLVLEEDDE